MKKLFALLLTLILILTSINISPLTVNAEEKLLSAEETVSSTYLELKALGTYSPPKLYSAGTDYEGATKAIIEGLEAWSTSIDISAYNIPVSELADFYYGCLYSNPHVFYAMTGLSYYSSGQYATRIIPKYVSEFTKEHVAIYEAKVASILKTIPSGLSDMEKALALHDYIVSHCEYDYTYSRYDSYNLLVNGIAVCQGYTLGYTDLLNRVGIASKYVVSDPMNHAWNLVQIDGKWYQVDCTWDDPLYTGSPNLGGVRHINFLRSDAGITSTGHYDWVVSETCTSTTYDSYYWADIESAIIYTDADTCYYMRGGNLYRRVGDTETVVSSTATDRWYVWGSTSSFWTGGYNRLAMKNDILYYNSTDTVYAYDTTTGEESVFYTYTNGKGYIYGIAESVDCTTINIEIKTAPNSATVEIIELPPMSVAFQYGDGNGDGIVDVKDAVVIKKYIAGISVTIDLVASDVNADNVVDVKDAVKIAKKLSGMDVELGAA